MLPQMPRSKRKIKISGLFGNFCFDFDNVRFPKKNCNLTPRSCYTYELKYLKYSSTNLVLDNSVAVISYCIAPEIKQLIFQKLHLSPQ